MNLRDLINKLDRDQEQKGFQILTPKFRQSPTYQGVTGFSRNASQGVRDFGNALGTSFSSALNSRRQAEETRRLIEESNRTLQAAKQARERGNKQGAIQLTQNMGNRLGAINNSYARQNANLPTEQEMNQKLASGGFRTGLTILGGSAPTKAVVGNSVVGGGLNILLGDKDKSVATRFGEGAGDSIKYSGLNRITNGIIGRLPQITQARIANMPTIQKAIFGAGTNLAEDMTYSRLAENRNLTAKEAAFSAALPVVSEFGGAFIKAVRNGKSAEIKVHKNKGGFWVDDSGNYHDPVTKQFVSKPKDIEIAKKNQKAQPSRYFTGTGGDKVDSNKKILFRINGKVVPEDQITKFDSNIDTPKLSVEPNSPKGIRKVQGQMSDLQTGNKVSQPQLVSGKNTQVPYQSVDPTVGKQPLLPGTKGMQQNMLPKNQQLSKASSLPDIISSKGKLNTNRLNASDQGKGVIQSVQSETTPTVIGNKDVVKAAELAKGSKGLTDEAMKKIMADQLKDRQLVVDYTKQFDQAKARGASEEELAKIMLKISEQSKVAQSGRTFAGRLLQAGNIIADESATPMQKVFALLDNAGVSEEKYMKDAVKVDWNNPTETVKFYRKYVPPKFGEVLDEFRYTNMLSSPSTHITNIASNLLQTGVVAPIEKTLTGTLDFGKSLLTGKERRYYARSGIDYAGGYVKALPDAFKNAWNVMSGKEITLRPDFENVPTAPQGLMKAYTTPLRMLEASDQFFSTLVKGGVTNELKNGPQKLSNIKIADKAGKEATYRLFRQAFDPDGKLGQNPTLQLFDKWNSAIGNLRRLPGGKWVLPFLQTPTNILKQGIEYSPLGLATIPKAANPVEQLSKTVLGSTVLLGAFQFAKQGMTTWEPPSGEKERELYYAAGIQPYSIKIGDKWVSYSKLGPLSYPFAMAAAFANAEKMNPDKSVIENIGKATGGMLGFFGDQSYVRSIGDLVDAIQGGVNVGANAFSGQAANFAGQLMPYKSFMTWIGRMTDPIYRKASTFGERMIKDLPLVGQNLDSYKDINGQPSRRDFPILNSFSPYKITQEKPGIKIYDQYQEGKVKKGVQKRADEAFLAGSKNVEVSNESVRYINEDGDLKTIDITKFTKPAPTDPVEKVRFEKDRFDTAMKIYRAEGLSDQEKADGIKKIGAKEDEVAYYDIASDETDVKRAFIDSAISQSEDKLEILGALRREVGGKLILSNGIIDDLEDDGVLTDKEAKYLKSLKWDKASNTIKIKAGKKKKVSIKRPNVSSSKITISKPRYQAGNIKIAPIKSLKLAPMKKRSIKII